MFGVGLKSKSTTRSPAEEDGDLLSRNAAAAPAGTNVLARLRELRRVGAHLLRSSQIFQRAPTICSMHRLSVGPRSTIFPLSALSPSGTLGLPLLARHF